ncbi:hypothetical protein D910_07575 [Dendroctonus ponderosae]
MPGINIFREHRNELRPHQDELMELTYLAGIHMNKDVFRRSFQLSVRNEPILEQFNIAKYNTIEELEEETGPEQVQKIS